MPSRPRAIARSLVLFSGLAVLLHGCLGDGPSVAAPGRDAGADASDARAEASDVRDGSPDTGDERGDASDASADASGDASGDAADARAEGGGSACPVGSGCVRAGGAAGVCTAFGACVECLNQGDGRCAGDKPYCTTAFTCVECTAPSHCNPTTEKCRNGSCIVRCGDGVIDPDEDCERGIAGWTVNNCDFATCKRTVYENCRSDSTKCSQQVLCAASFTCFEQSDSNCVTSCPSMPGYTVGCASGLCYIDCTSGRCPGDTHCTRDVAIGSATVNMCFGD